jgi:hypothetical protein
MSTQGGNRLKIEGSQVLGPDDLPPTLWLGTRDDASFVRTQGGFSCAYVYQDRVVQVLTYESPVSVPASWHFADAFGEPGARPDFRDDGARGLIRRSEGSTLLEALLAHAEEPWDTEDPREHWIAEQIAARAGMEYLVEPPESFFTELVPDGKVKCMVIPLHADRVAAFQAQIPALEERFRAKVILESKHRMVIAICAPPMSKHRMVIAIGGAQMESDAARGLEEAVQASVGGPVAETRSTPFDGRQVLLMIQTVSIAYIVAVWRDVLPLVEHLAGAGLLPATGAGPLTRGEITDAARAARRDFYLPLGAESTSPSPGDFVVIYPRVDVSRLRPEDIGE